MLREECLDSSCKREMGSMGLKEKDILDTTKWKNDIHDHSGDPR